MKDVQFNQPLGGNQMPILITLCLVKGNVMARYSLGFFMHQR
jgi:hypothetical protein